MRSRISAIMLLCLPVLILAACSKGNAPSSTTRASFQFVNTSVYNTSLNVLEGNNSLFGSLQYPDSSGYVPLTLPAPRFSVVSGSDTLARIDTNWMAGKQYTLFVMDSVGMGQAEIARIQDSFPPLQPGYAGVRFLNFCGVAPSLDLYDSISAKYLFTDRYFGETDTYSSTFQSVTSGTYNLQIRVPGELVYVANIPDMILQPGIYYTLYARGTTTVQPNLKVAIGVLEHP